MGRPRRGEGPEATPLDGRERVRWERALAAALRGPALSRSARGRELLRYLVGETLAGRRHRITGVTIAQDVLGRDASFDSESDAIVRVQMRRLRVQLAQDQAAGAPGGAPWIAIPKGAYRPELTEPRATAARRGAAAELAEPARPWRGARPPSPEPSEEPRDAKESDDPSRGPRRLLLGALALFGAAAWWLASDDATELWAERAEGRAAPGVPAETVLASGPLALGERPALAVLPFRNLTGDPRNDAFSRGLQSQIAADLQRFGGVRALALDGPPPEGEAAPARYLVGGSLLALEGDLEAFVFPTDAGTRRSVLSRRVEERAAAADGRAMGCHALLARLSRAASGRVLAGAGASRGWRRRMAPSPGAGWRPSAAWR